MGKFVIGSSVDGYRFMVESYKGEVLAVSPFYPSEDKCHLAINKVKKAICSARVYDGTKGGEVYSGSYYFFIYKDSYDMYRFSLECGKDNVILNSPAYPSFQYCTDTILKIKKIVKGY